jgi:hypothetical protein
MVIVVVMVVVVVVIVVGGGDGSCCCWWWWSPLSLSLSRLSQVVVESGESLKLKARVKT